MYEFGEDIGGLDPSFFFGFRKDLYHFDHFMVRHMFIPERDHGLFAQGQFQSKLPQLMDVARYEVVSVGPEQGAQAVGSGPWVLAQWVSTHARLLHHVVRCVTCVPNTEGQVEVLVDVETSVGAGGTYRFVMKVCNV